MTITIEGSAAHINRIVTGFHTFDLSMQNRRGRIGLPLLSTIEVYGPNNVGKSTTVYSLAGMIANQLHGNIVLADFERFDPETLNDVLESQGFTDGTLRYINEEEDEEALGKLLTALRDDGFRVGIVDSIGAISPIAELSGDLGEANMGRRARLMGPFIRKATHIMKRRGLEGNDAIVFTINHQHPAMGSRTYGTTTPGGETLKYLYAVRMNIKRKWITKSLSAFPDGSYVIEGKIIKNAFGYRDRMFWLTVLAGSGIHQGLTAMWDCIELKEASFKSGIVQLGSEKWRIKRLVDAAHEGNTEIFIPFVETLQGSTKIIEAEEPINTEEGDNNDD
jgi:recombination protein RecA